MKQLKQYIDNRVEFFEMPVRDYVKNPKLFMKAYRGHLLKRTEDGFIIDNQTVKTFAQVDEIINKKKTA
jgi:hypothetical protein